MSQLRVILSSHSPRRRELLAALDVPFTVEVGPDAPERYDDALPHRGIPEFLSRSKSLAFHRLLADDEVLLTADTLVMLPGAGTDPLDRAEILGKPASREDAFAMLRALSGRTHYVLTGVTLRNFVQVGESRNEVAQLPIAEIFHAETEFFAFNRRARVIEQ